MADLFLILKGPPLRGLYVISGCVPRAPLWLASGRPNEPWQIEGSEAFVLLGREESKVFRLIPAERDGYLELATRSRACQMESRTAATNSSSLKGLMMYDFSATIGSP